MIIVRPKPIPNRASQPHIPIREVQRLLMLLCVLTLSLPSAGTSIVAVKNAADIFIGADRMQLHPASHRKGQARKIMSINSSFVAVAGLSDDTEAFHVLEILKHCLTGVDLRTGIRIFEEQIRQPLLDAVKRFAKRDASGYAKYLQDRTVLSVAFAGREPNGTLLLAVRSYKVSDDLKSLLEASPEDFDGKHTAISFLGRNDAIASFADRSASYWANDTPRRIREMICQEAKAQPEFVAGPIDLVRIRADGKSQIYPAAGCR